MQGTVDPIPKKVCMEMMVDSSLQPGQSLPHALSKYELRKALQYIHQNLAEPISLEAIATHVGISHFYFCHLFKQAMGITPYQYLLQQRIERAKQLLLQDQQSISDIALATGFSDQSHFSKQFKRFIGTTPRRFIQQSQVV